MSRRTDVLNKYPAPRVSAVNQAVPGCSQGSYASPIYYTTTILLLYFVLLLLLLVVRVTTTYVRARPA